MGLAAHCNEGELFTYAETLSNRIGAGESKGQFCAYLSDVQSWRSRTLNR
jgi:hypothetical protein